MIHEHRRFSIADVASPGGLACKLTHYTWCGCTGFRLSSAGHVLLFLNDAFSPDGAQEYAVVKDQRQIESITFSWCSEAEALDLIEELQAGTLGDDYGPCTPVIESPAVHGRCGLCA